MKTFEQILQDIKSQNKINESMNWMAGIIPAESEWEKVQLSPIVGHDTYSFKILDKVYVIPNSKIDWFKENIGKEIKFLYDNETREIMRAEPVNKLTTTNEAINSEDLRNILIKFSKFLYDEGYFRGMDIHHDESREELVNRFLG